MLLSIIKADYLQRTRSSNFWFTIMIFVVATVFMFPSPSSNYAVVDISGYRGIYNSAWMGATLAMINSMMLPLFSFYLIKNSLKLDRLNHCNEILAASTLNRFHYLFGKFVSNVGILLTFIFIMSFVAIFVQLYQGEDYQLDIIAIIKPQLYLVIPVLFVVAAMAILFETISWLRNGFGNFAYLYVWMFMFIGMMENDLGPELILSQMENTVLNLGGEINSIVIGGSIINEPLKTFLWTGFEISNKVYFSIQIYFIITAIALLLSMAFFKRYDVSGESWIRRVIKFKGKSKVKVEPQLNKSTNLSALSVMPSYPLKFTFFRIVKGELSLLIASINWFWKLISLAQIIAALVLPLEIVKNILLLVHGVWAALMISGLGNRDIKANTLDLVNSSPFSETARLASAWVSGITVLLILSSGLIARFVIEMEIENVLQLLASALFIAALALTLGRLTGTSRAFESIFIMIWYIGPADGRRFLDFLGKTIPSDSISATATDSRVLFFILFAFVLMAITYSFLKLKNNRFNDN